MVSHAQKSAEQWYDLQAAADYVGLSTRSIRNYISGGRLPAFRLGPRQIRIRKTDLDALLQPIPTAGTAA